jgi:DNA-binding MarR family transcriptional regulator
MRSAEKTISDQHLPARAARTLIRVGCRMMYRETMAARREGLPPLQASLLMRIFDRPEREATVGLLASALGLTPPTVSDSLKAMVRKGLLVRSRSDDDRRVVYFQCTTPGRATARRLAHWVDPLEKTIANLSPGDQQALMALLSRILRDSMSEQGPSPDAMCATCNHLEPIDWSVTPARFHCLLADTPLYADTLKLDCPRYKPLQAD